MLPAARSLGLSFEARFQMGFMIVGLFAWLVFLQKPGVRKVLATVAGITVVFALGRWIDRWGYGEWVLSPWRYVEYNLLRGEVNHYGQAPVWDVFRMAFTESWPFLGLGVAAASIIAWVRHPRHPLTWSQVPFFLVHEAIAHKELRFFFPIALGGPVLLDDGAHIKPGPRGRPAVHRPLARGGGLLVRVPIRWAWRFLLANNLIALVALSITPFSRAVQFYDEVWNSHPAGQPPFRNPLYRHGSLSPAWQPGVLLPSARARYHRL